MRGQGRVGVTAMERAGNRRKVAGFKGRVKKKVFNVQRALCSRRNNQRLATLLLSLGPAAVGDARKLHIRGSRVNDVFIPNFLHLCNYQNILVH